MIPIELEPLETDSLESLQALNIKNRKQLDQINTDSSWNRIAIILPSGIVIAIVVLQKLSTKQEKQNSTNWTRLATNSE